MFWGSHRVRVDEKGRLAIPAQFRRQLPEGSFISIGQDGVLTIYPPEQWETLASRLQDPLLGPEQRALSRALFSQAVACEFWSNRGNVSSGTVDIRAIMQWLKSKGWFGDVTLGNVQFGFEITSSAGGKNFTTNSFSVTG